MTTTINKENMFSPMLEACPSFRVEWEEFCSEWQDEEDKPLYLALTDLAYHLFAKYEKGETHNFNTIFGVIESWLSDGDDYVKEAATVGLLEDIQKAAGSKAPEFEQWLKPKSKESWKALNKFWDNVETRKAKDHESKKRNLTLLVLVFLFFCLIAVSSIPWVLKFRLP